MTPATRPTQVRALDGIRGIAVLLVMAYHCELMGTDQKAYQFLRGGWAGVDIFFVLSGYLITSGLIAGPIIGTQLLRPFYARRLRRLAPAALALLTVWLVLSLTGLVPVVWLGHPPGSSKLLLALAPVVGLLTLSYNWVMATSQPNAYGMGQLWSLTIEEQFYLVWPTLVCIAFRRPERALKTLLVGLAVAAVAAVGFTLWAADSGHRNLAYFGTPTRMFGLVVGAALALLHARVRTRGGRRQRLRIPARAAALASIVFLGFVAARAPDVATYMVPVISIAVAVVVWVAITDEKVGNSWFRWGWLRWCGRRSYALYLWHPLCLVELQHLLGVGWESAVVSVAAAFVCAALSWRFIESRFMHRKPAVEAAVAPALAPPAAVAPVGAALPPFAGLPARR